MEINKLRQQLWQLNRERARLQGELCRPGRMVRGTITEVYKRCSNRNCRCWKEDKRHGPYLYLVEPVGGGKRRCRHVRRDDWEKVRRLVKEYIKFQKKMARIRKINNEIFQILKLIREENIEEYE